MHNFPTLEEFNNLFPNDIECTRYLLNYGAFYNEYNCSKCGYAMKLYFDSKCFRCNRRACISTGCRISFRIGTFFYGSALSCLEIMRMAHLWLAKSTIKTTIFLTGHSEHTVCNFFKHYRQLISSSLTIEDQIIGGPGVVVEIDETKLGKRKYNRGHHVDGVWVVVGVEKMTNGKIFLVPVEERSGVVLRRIIQSHVREGSIVNTDTWRGYQDLESLGLTHISVNHSQTFKDPVTGACTNTAEGTNSGLKRAIPVRNRTRNGIETHLSEYIWRKINKGRLFEAFLDAIKDMHYFH